MDKQIAQISDWLGSGSINIFGRPFAGKDTQAEKMAELLNGNVIGGGEILRSQPIPDYVKQALDAGKLVPTDYYLSILIPYLSQPRLAGKPILLSSVGRWHGEEASIIKGTTEAGHEIKAVIHLVMTDQDVRQRLEAAKAINDRGPRDDDELSILENRLDEYRNKTLPVIEFYRQAGLLIEIDGTKTRQEVTQEILDELSKLAV